VGRAKTDPTRPRRPTVMKLWKRILRVFTSFSERLNVKEDPVVKSEGEQESVFDKSLLARDWKSDLGRYASKKTKKKSKKVD
jgi:hypothetical protein